MRIWERVPHHARKGNRCGYTQFQRRELSCRITLSYTGKRGREKEKRPVSSSSTKENIQPDLWLDRNWRFGFWILEMPAMFGWLGGGEPLPNPAKPGTKQEDDLNAET
jgi:hypothetical protein